MAGLHNLGLSETEKVVGCEDACCQPFCSTVKTHFSIIFSFSNHILHPQPNSDVYGWSLILVKIEGCLVSPGVRVLLMKAFLGTCSGTPPDLNVHGSHSQKVCCRSVQCQEHGGDTRTQASTPGEGLGAIVSAPLCSEEQENYCQNLTEWPPANHSFSAQNVWNQLHEGGIRVCHPQAESPRSPHGWGQVCVVVVVLGK